MDKEQGLRALVHEAAATREERLGALRELAAGLPARAAATGESNNHVHTIYSFSPYTPSAAALRSREAGLEVAGSVDHDSIAAAGEMVAACALVGIGGVTGCELRVGFKDGPFARRKINNPDSEGIVYMTIQGVPKDAAPRLDAYLKPIRSRRIQRTKRMAEAASALLEAGGLEGIEFEADILPRSKAAEGGGVTERHLLAAVADRLVERYGRGEGLVTGLEKSLGVKPPARIAALLADPGNSYLTYDLLGVLKAGFLDRIFIQPDASESLSGREVVAFARSIGAVPAYAYLGDVGESPTGDKKAEKFEDEFLEELMPELKAMGYLAVTYMPPRDSRAQLDRVRKLCGRYGFMEISGVDINSPRQSFNCPELRSPEFRHLSDTTWALVAHERFASVDARLGLFSPDNTLSELPLDRRISAYARAGRALDPRRPEAVADLISDLQGGRFTR